tara:strand:- start:37 stop:399 length:363 start_codon:yes stop_codon:yes gene_type:complete
MQANKFRTLTESQVQKVILQWLEMQKDLTVIRFNAIGIPLGETGKFRPIRMKGVSDLICCVRGKFLAIEVKREKGGKLSDYQKAFLQTVEDVGGRAIVATSLDEVIETVNEIRKERNVFK